MFKDLFSPTGGLIYHSRALRYGRAWKPFNKKVEAWLQDWHPQSSSLVLVGPSAGYTLPKNLLSRFDTCIGVELDPMARSLFRMRRGPLLWDQRNYFSPERGEFNPKGPTEFARKYQGCAVLFCNVLGQMLPQDPFSQGFETYSQSLKNSLQNLEWASYHDRLSGRLKPKSEAFSSEQRLNDTQLIERAYPKTTGELSEHGTWGFFPENLPAHYWSWELTPGTYHLVEALKKTT